MRVKSDNPNHRIVLSKALDDSSINAICSFFAAKCCVVVVTRVGKDKVCVYEPRKILNINAGTLRSLDLENILYIISQMILPLDKRKVFLGYNNVGTLSTMNNLANLYLEQRKYDKAEPLFVECLDKRRVLLGDDHVDTLHSMNNLATFYCKQGKYDKAEPLFVECLNKRIVLS
jgi:hypothetical protein